MVKETDDIQEKLDELIEISRFYGKNDEYVIAGGGNTSYKSEEKIWIKASGTSLANIDKDDFVCLSRSELRKISTKIYSQNSRIREARVKEDLQKAIISENGKRPSVETSLHEIIEYKFIVHTHPTLVNALMCSRKAKRLTRKLFGKHALFIEYTDPGYVLFKKVESSIISYRERFSCEPKIIFLQNHGVFVSGDSPDEIKNQYTEIELILKDQIDSQLPPNQGQLSEEYVHKQSKTIANQLDIDPSHVCYRINGLIQKYTISPDVFDQISRPFTPDDIVYCKSNYLFTTSGLDSLKIDVTKFAERYGYLPKIIAVQGKGLVSIETGQQSPATVMDVFENMMKVRYFSEIFGGPQFMNPEQIDFIDNWEVENYRRTVTGD